MVIKPDRSMRYAQLIIKYIGEISFQELLSILGFYVMGWINVLGKDNFIREI